MAADYLRLWAIFYYRFCGAGMVRLHLSAKGLDISLYWLLIALATGVTFVGYFTPIRELVMELPTLEAHGWSYFWVGFFLVFTYLNAGWLREQVCIYMCPYARFQSVMFDRDTLIVSYDEARGEPRGRRKKSLSHTQATANSVCRSAPPALIYATACNTSASHAPLASMPATA